MHFYRCALTANNWSELQGLNLLMYSLMHSTSTNWNKNAFIHNVLCMHISIYCATARICVCYRPSVRLSHGWISRQRLKLGPYNLYHHSSFREISFIQKFWRVPTRAGHQTRVGWGGKTSYFLALWVNISQKAQLLLRDRATGKPAKDCWNGRGNNNLGWIDLQMYFKVIKSGTNRKLVYDFFISRPSL